MDTALRLPIKVSSATSNFMICVTAAVSAGAYILSEAISLLRSPVPSPWGQSLARSSAPISSCPFQTTEFVCCLW
jgi:hypothetical protein